MPPLFVRQQLAIISSALVLFATGCANMANTTPSGDPFGVASVIQGRTFGGNQPIAFASVKLYSVGNTGYGSAGTLVATTATSDDGNGSWSFNKQPSTNTPYPSSGNTWACPASSDPYIYAISSGGNTQNTHDSSLNNSAAVAIVLLGRCSSLTSSSFFNLNEVTTVATLAALQQFFNPATESIGAPGTSSYGIDNAVTNIPMLANVSTGTAAGSVANGYYRAVPEMPKINTIANILAACINNPLATASACNTLFTSAVPPNPIFTSQPTATFSTATDTVQAAYYMLSRPANDSPAHLANLYNLSSAQAPFQPSLAVAPYDWNIGVTFVSIVPKCGAGSQLIHSDMNIAIDALSHVLLTNTGGGYGGYVKITSAGAALDIVSSCSSSAESHQSTVDPIGHTFTTFDNLSQIVENVYVSTITFTTPVIPLAIASDSSGNIFYTAQANNSVYEISAATIASLDSGGVFSPVTVPATTSTLIASNLGGTPGSIVVDAAGNVWVGTGATGMYELPKSTGYVPKPVPGTGSGAPYYLGASVNAMAVDANGSVIFPFYSSANQALVGVVGGGPSTFTFNSVYGTQYTAGIAIDGANKYWAAVAGTLNTGSSRFGFVTVSTAAGVSAINGYGILKPASSSLVSSTLVQDSTVMGPSSSIAIDFSGNVWVSNSSTNQFSTALGQQYSVTELIGAAVPVVSPFSAASLATKP